MPVFVLDPKLLASEYVGQARLARLDGLRELDKSLKQIGSRLILRRGDHLKFSLFYRVKRMPKRFLLRKTSPLMPASAIGELRFPPSHWFLE